MRTPNYLDNLVARSLPDAVVVQPRPVTPFEPWPAAETGAIPLIEEEGVTDHTTVAPSDPVQHTPVQPLPVQPPHLPAHQSLSPEPILSQQVAPQTADQSKPVKPDPVPLPVSTQPPSTTPAPLPAHDQPEPGPAQVVNTREITREQVMQPTPTALAPAKTIPTLVKVVREQVIQPAPPTAAPGTATTIREQPIILTKPDVTILPAQAQPPAQPNNQPSIHKSQVTIHNSQFSVPPVPVPTIQVTIGRIEVRATPPAPAKAEKKQPQASVMSLDDYLRRRNGERP